MAIHQYDEIRFVLASSLRKLCYEKKKIEILVSMSSKWSETSRNMIFSWYVCGCCVYVLDFDLIFGILNFFLNVPGSCNFRKI